MSNDMNEKGRNPETGANWIDEDINRRARKKGQWKYYGDSIGYSLFDREGYIEACLKAGRPFVITWVPNIKRLECRHYQDVHGVSDLFGIEEVPTLFSSRKGMERYRIFLIPYLLTGYAIPSQLEEDPEPLVPFTAKTIERVKEIEEENVQVQGLPPAREG